MTISLGQKELDEIWHRIEYELIWLHSRWIIYRQLFGTDAERVDILNRSASTFANTLQTVLLDDVQLGLANLGDPADSGRFKNLTFARLANDVIATGVLSDKLPTLLDAYAISCTSIRDRRNKRIAHFDLDAKLQPIEQTFGPSREEIEAALLAGRNFMNCIEQHFCGSQTAYELTVLQSDGDSLISTLRAGLRYRKLVADGIIERDDLAKSVFAGKA